MCLVCNLELHLVKMWWFNVSGPEYGTNKLALLSMLVEAEELADLRLMVRDRLFAEVIVQLKEWKAANYHKQMVGSCREAKTFEEEFHKVFRIKLAYKMDSNVVFTPFSKWHCAHFTVLKSNCYCFQFWDDVIAVCWILDLGVTPIYFSRSLGKNLAHSISHSLGLTSVPLEI